MERAIELLSSLTKRSTEEIQSALESDESFDLFKSEVNNLKVYTSDEFSSVLNNLRRDQKDSIYREAKGSIHEKIEKDIISELGLDLKKGEDYETTVDLIKKIKEASTKNIGDDEAKMELDKLQQAYKTQKEEFESQIEVLKNYNNSELTNFVLKSEINKLKGDLDVEDNLKDGQLQLFDIALRQKYEIRRDEDGSFVVWNKDTQEYVKNDDMSRASVSQVISQVAPNYLKFKEVTPRKGRGSGLNKNSNPSRINWAKYDNDFNTYFVQELKGKGLRMGDPEVTKRYMEFKDAMG